MTGERTVVTKIVTAPYYFRIGSMAILIRSLKIYIGVIG